MLNYATIHQIADIFSVNNMLVSLIISVYSAVMMLFLSKKSLQILQQSSYSNFDFIRWIERKSNVYIKKLTVVCILTILSSVLVSVAFNFISLYFALAFVVFYAFFVFLYVLGERKQTVRVKLVITPRIIRLAVCHFLLSTFFSLVLVLIINALFFVINVKLLQIARFGLVALGALLVPYVLFVANFLMRKIERLIAKRYIAKAKQKMQTLSDVLVIGITGSYGKTSIKNILHTMLSEKYKVFSTPKSYNTPMGVCKSIEQLDSSYDVFIVEMGARRPGDIAELCNIVSPDYAVISAIGEQHFDTFNSLDEIINTKAELAKSIKNGTVFVSADSENALKIKEFCTAKVVTCGMKPTADVVAHNVSNYSFGSNFVLNLDAHNKEVSTRLLGEHNVTNVCLGSAVCFELGLDLSQIASGISRVEQVPHRLQLVQNTSGLIVIDDGFSSNIVGAENAIKVAKSFGKRCIVVTPGIVEMGSLTKKINQTLGSMLAVFDKIILVGSYATYYIKQGLLNENYNFKNVIMVKTLDEARAQIASIATAGDVVLFENDLPDKFM